MKYIYETGITSVGIRICEIDLKNKVYFWSPSELKKIKPEFFTTAKQLKSFLRTKKWVIKYYPELLL
jgi:hypothetical protein